jgi:hypothetical protein
MEAACSTETLVPSYMSTRCHNPDDHHRHAEMASNGMLFIHSFKKFEYLLSMKYYARFEVLTAVKMTML